MVIIFSFRVPKTQNFFGVGHTSFYIYLGKTRKSPVGDTKQPQKDIRQPQINFCVPFSLGSLTLLASTNMWLNISYQVLTFDSHQQASSIILAEYLTTLLDRIHLNLLASCHRTGF